MAALDSLAEVTNILEEWTTETYAEGLATADPIPKLTRLCEIMERETEAYYKMDPDPFDDRHPGRANPTCTLGHLFKALFKNEDFMNRLVTSYVLHSGRNLAIQTVACRLLYDILPGLETSVVFQETEGLVEQLLKWAEKGEEPIRSYATGLLAGAMELQDIASNFKEKNSALVPIMLQRLHSLQKEMHEEYEAKEKKKASDTQRHFQMFSSPKKASPSHAFEFTTPKSRSRSPAKSSDNKLPIRSDIKGDMVIKEGSCSSEEAVSKDGHTGASIDMRNISGDTGPTADSDIKGKHPTDCSNDKPAITEQEGVGVNKIENAVVTETTSLVNGEKNAAVVANSGENVNGKVCLSPGKSHDVIKSQSQLAGCSTDFITPLSGSSSSVATPQVTNDGTFSDVDSEDDERPDDNTVEDRKARLKRALSPSFYSSDMFRLNKKPKTQNNDGFLVSDVSNSSWADIEPYVIGSFSLNPLSIGMKQRLILQYLTPMGEYQELISAAFEHRAMDLVFYYINLKYNRDVRLAFEALKYLAVLLCHKKFAIEFLQRSGVQKLLDVYRPSIAATGVSLCLYYLSYFEDAMERVCLLSDHILTTLVSYILWLLECSHDSSRYHAAMFFTQAFPFYVILNRFDTQDGLRRLYNVISTLGILNVEDNSNLTEDQVFTMRQSARHVCVSLKRYFESHLILKVNELKRSHDRTEGWSTHHETPAYKALKITPDIIQENVELMMELMPVRQQWQPEATFHKLGGIQLLSQLVAMSPDWNSYTGKPETIKAALDVISICCVTPRSQLTLLSNIPLPENVSTPAISVFIGVAEGEVISEPDVQRSALSVLINCVCGPLERLGGGVGRYMGSGAKKKVNLKLGEDVLSKMWNGIRENNGIMVLLKLLSITTPITDADSIRALACKALAGMARSETVRQIISKLPLFCNGQLQTLMKEPVLQDKSQEHVKFCRYATDLIEKVMGKQANRYTNASLDDIRKADIVAQSRIIFHEKELLQLICDHLLAQGFHDSAEMLQREAGLHRSFTPPPATNSTHFAPVQVSSPSSMFMSPPSGLVTPKAVNRPLAQLYPSGPVLSMSLSQLPQAGTSQGSTSSQNQSTPGTPGGPLRFSFSRHSTQSSTALRHPTPQQPVTRCKYVKDRDMNAVSPAIRRSLMSRSQTGENEITLDKIVTEYLRKQHALCPNPVVTCPPMSLFQPHRCPEPRKKTSAPCNFTVRTMEKMIFPKYGGMDGCKMDRKMIYSRFKPIRTYKESEDDGYSCCTFANLQTTQPYLMLGTYAGNLKLINTNSAEETGSFHCHSSPVTHCEHSLNGKLVLTSSSYGIMNSSALWSWGSETLDNAFHFGDYHLEFSRHVQDRLVGTKDEVANIYDIVTGEKLLTLYDADKANNYKANRAVFNPTDDLVLHDGILWDTRTGKAIHKFDKFNQYVSGVFHPKGLEIIINSEVWDIRSFHLLHTVAALDQCQIHFSPMADVMYATRIDEELDHESDRHNPYGSTFRTFDATNYSHIATVDVKSRSISDLCTDRQDMFLAVVENQHSTEMGAEENICRLYEIGKVKDDDDQQNEEEEEAHDESNSDDDDDDDNDMDDFDFQVEGDDDDDNDDDDGASGENEGENAGENGENQGEDGGDTDDDDDDDDTDDDDDDDDDLILSLGSDEDDDDDGDFDVENAFFELADL